VINTIDLLTIYLACGAPFGVYYFLKNRASNSLRILWLKSFLNFLFWIPLALSVLRQNLNFKDYVTGFDQTSATDAVQENNISLIQKKLERILLKSRLSISVYGFRETIERYVGLTLAEKTGGKKIAEHEKEIFRISLLKNVESGSVCLHRRNRKRLLFHQIAAREDFLHLVRQLSKSGLDGNELKHLSIALTELTKDFEARDKLEKMFAGSMQTDERAHVKKVEKDLWKPEIRNSQPARLTSNSQAVKATMNLRRKD